MSDENFSPQFGTPYQAIIDHLEAGDNRLIATSLNTADRYFPALAQVLFAGHTPADAVSPL